MEPLTLLRGAPILLTGALLLAVAGCGGPAAGTAPGPAASASVAGTSAGSPAGEVPPARVGTPAASQRIRFVPTSIELPGGVRAPVDPASTVGGLLAVPETGHRVGWWDGGAQAGDPYGAMVIAGHVDTAKEGVGFFARLLRVKPGDRVAVTAGTRSAAYKVVSVHSVPKNALATGTFDQTGNHRLVLITCTGRYDRARGGYERNFVVSAVPLGPAR